MNNSCRISEEELQELLRSAESKLNPSDNGGGGGSGGGGLSGDVGVVCSTPSSSSLGGNLTNTGMTAVVFGGAMAALGTAVPAFAGVAYPVAAVLLIGGGVTWGAGIVVNAFTPEPTVPPCDCAVDLQQEFDQSMGLDQSMNPVLLPAGPDVGFAL